MQSTTPSNAFRWATGITALAGVWVLIAPFVLGYSGTQQAMLNDVIVGLAVLVLAGIRLFGALSQTWLSWLAALLGLWLLVSPFVLGNSGTPMTNDIIFGIVIIVFGVWSAMTRGEGVSVS